MDLSEVRRRMADGRLYACNSPELFAEQERRRDVLDAYNALPFSSSAERDALLARLVAEVGENCMIEPPFHANWGGANTWAATSMPTWASSWWMTPTSSSRTTS